jgi:hypothetical protein
MGIKILHPSPTLDHKVVRSLYPNKYVALLAQSVSLLTPTPQDNK